MLVIVSGQGSALRPTTSATAHAESPARGAAAVVQLQDCVRRPRRIALGVFDGVHAGHREVITGCDAVVTFEPHPMRVLSPESAPPMLTSMRRRAELVGALGVPELVVVPFDRRLASVGADRFVEETLVGCLDAVHVAVGVNFRFGHRGLGDPALLEQDARFETRTVGLSVVDDAVVSSTRIRALVEDGAVLAANELLGADLTLETTAAAVTGSTRTGGVTVRAQVADGFVAPPNGVYAATASLPTWSAPSAVRFEAGHRRGLFLADVHTEHRDWNAGDLRFTLHRRIHPVRP